MTQIKHFFIISLTIATSATMRAMFERLGFTPGAAASLEGNDHGINTLEELVFLNDKDIDSLVMQRWHQGGMITGPTIVGRAVQGKPVPLVANPGHSVSSGLRLISIWQCSTCTANHGFQELCHLQSLH
jgi:hypothetical protein